VSKLEDKVCVVTGGAQGIGAAIAEELARHGGRIAILDLDDVAAETRAAELRRGGAAARAIRCDVADRESVSAAAAAVERELGPAGVLVNNAGLALIGPSLDFAEDDWRRSLDVMTTGVFFCCQAFGRQMVERGGGAVVNISSMNATVAFPGRLAYNAAKAAVKSMTEVLAIEWAVHGIRVNAVAPGVTRTALVDRAIGQGHVDLDAYVRRTPMRRLADPSEIAKAVLFLASDQDSSFVTGHSLVVDGGWSAYGFIPLD
jgi:NAD(P)-dependent dehydrogenase (short-subunit alcohol dehydrogenase family)